MTQTDEIRRTETENFTCNITWLRRVHGYSKKQMALRLGIGIKSLTTLENGTIPPKLSANIFLTIYDTFGIHPEALLNQRLQDSYALPCHSERSEESPVNRCQKSAGTP